MILFCSKQHKNTNDKDNMSRLFHEKMLMLNLRKASRDNFSMKIVIFFLKMMFSDWMMKISVSFSFLISEKYLP